MKENDPELEPLNVEAFVRIPWVLADPEAEIPPDLAKELRLVVTELDDLHGATQLEPGDTPGARLTEARLLLGMKARQWKKNRNPMAAIEAILIAYEGGFYPPLWALRWLCEGLAKWGREKGQKNLEQVLGLRGEKPGEDPAYKKAQRDDWHDKIRWDVWMLRHVFGITLAQAAEMVSRAMEDETKEKGSLDKTGWGVGKVLDARTIENISRGKDPFADFDDPEYIAKLIETWKAQKDAILSKFPGGIPPRRPHRRR